MLVLSRKQGESIVIGNGVTVTVLATKGGCVKLGFVAPAEVPVHREETYQKIERRLPALANAGCVPALAASPL